MDITFILEVVIGVCVILITRYVVPWLKSKSLDWLVNIAVSAAEQTMKDSTGAEKKEYVIKWLSDRNIKYDEDKIDAIIESAVYAIKSSANN